MLRQLVQEIKKYKRVPKDPISLLTELGQISKKPPVFEVRETDFTNPVKKYLCTAQFLYLEELGLGSSKQNAKRSASQEILKGLLHELDESIDEYVTLFDTVPEKNDHVVVNAVPSPPTSSSKLIKENCVGQLQEYAQKHGIPLPEYHELMKSGPDHAREFRVEAKLPSMSYIATGCGPTKKLAKKTAAGKLLEMVFESKSSPQTSQLGQLTSERGRSPLNPNCHKPNSLPIGLTAHSKPYQPQKTEPSLLVRHRVPHEPTLTTESSSQKASLLNQGQTSEDCSSSKLKALAEVNGVKVTYHYFDTIDPDKKVCLVEIHSQPPLVFSGTGRTKSDAEEIASRITLQDIKILECFKQESVSES